MNKSNYLYALSRVEISQHYSAGYMLHYVYSLFIRVKSFFFSVAQHVSHTRFRNAACTSILA